MKRLKRKVTTNPLPHKLMLNLFSEKNTVKEVNPARHIKSITSNLKLVLDRTESYEAGSTAELLIVAPFWPASVCTIPCFFQFLRTDSYVGSGTFSQELDFNEG